MPTLRAAAECPVHDSFRVQQVAGMFGLPVGKTCREEFDVDIPSLDEPWRIGAIVGPSGSGKSTVARAAFGEALYEPADWPRKRAVIDGLGEVPLKEAIQALTAVGLGSPPSWIKPYHALSCGEQFRCDLARALLAGGEGGCIVFDEFTSVVDRTSAKFAAAALAKAIRGGRISRRFVAVSCHDDILEWLEPDWTLDMSTGRLSRRRLRRHPLEIKLFRTPLDVWKTFASHHYLSGNLSLLAHCYLAAWNETPVAFCAVLNAIGRAKHKRISRLVVLPEFQGLGIGGRVLAAVADLYRRAGSRVNITTGHPGMIASLRRSPAWRCIAFSRTGRRADNRLGTAKGAASFGRPTASFEYVGA